jgi:hypothetical protein
MAKTDAIDEFFHDGFFPALGGSAPSRRGTPASAEVASLWGTKPTPSFERLIDFLGQQGEEDEPSLGELMAFPPSDWLVQRGNAFDFMLTEWYRRAALLSGTIPIGCTGCGDIWLIDAAPRESRHRVFLVDHEVGKIHAIADSLESLAWLCRLAAEGETSGTHWKASSAVASGYGEESDRENEADRAGGSSRSAR